MRAISRPKRVLSNAEVKKKLDALLRRPTTKPDTKFTIPLGIYQVRPQPLCPRHVGLHIITYFAMCSLLKMTWSECCCAF